MVWPWEKISAPEIGTVDTSTPENVKLCLNNKEDSLPIVNFQDNNQEEMEMDNNFKRVYTGSEVNVQYLQELLEKEGINSRIRNDFDSGLRAGFGGGLPGQVLLFADSDHFEKALKIVQTTFPDENDK